MQERVIDFNPGQWRAARSEAPTVVVKAGNGFGKTFFGTWWMIEKALNFADTENMIVCMNYDNAAKTVVPHLERALRYVNPRPRWVHGTPHQLTFANGSIVWIGSAKNPGSLQGPNLAFAWADEVAHWPKLSWENLATRNRLVVPSMDEVGARPQTLVTFTPYFGAWANEYFAEPSDRRELILGHATENKHLPQEHFDRLRDTFGEGSAWWRQAVYGEAVMLEGAVFSSFSRERNVGPPPVGVPLRYAEGIDWGWVDPTVILVCAQAQDGRLFIVDEWVQSHATMEEVLARCRTNRERYGVVVRFADPSQPANIARLAQAGLHCVAAPNAVLPGIGLVNGRFATGRLTIDAGCEETLREIGGYGWQVNADGDVKRERPQDGNDHCMDAMRYVVGGIDGLGTEVPVQRVTMQEVRPEFTPVMAGMARGGR